MYQIPAGWLQKFEIYCWYKSSFFIFKTFFLVYLVIGQIKIRHYRTRCLFQNIKVKSLQQSAAGDGLYGFRTCRNKVMHQLCIRLSAGWHFTQLLWVLWDMEEYKAFLKFASLDTCIPQMISIYNKTGFFSVFLVWDIKK